MMSHAENEGYEKARKERRDAPMWKQRLAVELLKPKRKRFQRRPLKNKTAIATARAIGDVITASKTSPEKLWTDRGTEFYHCKSGIASTQYSLALYIQRCESIYRRALHTYAAQKY